MLSASSCTPSRSRTSTARWPSCGRWGPPPASRSIRRRQHGRQPRPRPRRPGPGHDRQPRLRWPGLPGRHGAEGGRGPQDGVRHDHRRRGGRRDKRRHRGRRGRGRRQRPGGRQRAVPPSRRPGGRGLRAAGHRPRRLFPDLDGSGNVADTGCVPSVRWPLEVVPTRYGAAAVDALAAAVARAKDGEPLRPVTVVVPSNYAGVAARRALARRGGVVGVSFVTLYRLAELLGGVELARRGRVPISSPVVATAVRAVLSERPRSVRPRWRTNPRPWRRCDGCTGSCATSEAELDALARADARAAAVVGDRPAADGPAVAPLVRRDRSHGRGHGGRARRGAGRHHGRGHRAGGRPPPSAVVGCGGGAAARAGRHRIGDRARGPDRRRGRSAPLGLLERLGEPARDAARPAGTPRSVELAVAADEDDEVRLALRRVIRAAEEGIPLERVGGGARARAPRTAACWPTT